MPGATRWILSRWLAAGRPNPAGVDRDHRPHLPRRSQSAPFWRLRLSLPDVRGVDDTAILAPATLSDFGICRSGLTVATYRPLVHANYFGNCRVGHFAFG